MVVGTLSCTIVSGDSRAECSHSGYKLSTQGLLIRAIILGLCYLQVFVKNKVSLSVSHCYFGFVIHR